MTQDTGESTSNAANETRELDRQNVTSPGAGLKSHEIYGTYKSGELTSIWQQMSGSIRPETAAPDSQFGRIAATTLAGLGSTPKGLYNSCVYDIEHPLEIVKTVAASAAVGALASAYLPRTGAAGKIAGVVLGAAFVAGAAPGFVDAYKKGLNAQSWAEIHQAGEQWGNAAGRLGVDSALGYVGYKIGAGIAERTMSRGLQTASPSGKDELWFDPEEYKTYQQESARRLAQFNKQESAEFLKHEFAFLRGPKPANSNYTPGGDVYWFDPQEYKAYQEGAATRLAQFNKQQSAEFIKHEFAFLRGPKPAHQ
jgi:hypothetical protein